MVTKWYGVNLLFLTPTQVGGTQTYSVNLINELLKKLLPSEKLVLYCCKNNYELFQNNDKIKIRVLPIQSTNIFLRYITEQALLPILTLVDSITVLLSLGYTQPLFLKCRSIVTIHDLNWFYHPNDFSFLQRFFWKLLSTLSMKFSSHIISVSNYTKVSINTVLGINLNKITTIYHGINKPKYYTNREIKSILKKYNISSPYILSILSHYQHKNIDALLEAYKILRDDGIMIGLVIGGTGTQKDKKARRKLIDSSGLEDIVLLPYLTSNNVDKVYQGATIFVFPSLYEGFGFPVLEAMANQTPVLCSNTTSLPEIVKNASITFDPQEPFEIADRINSLLKNHATREELIIKGNIRYKVFTWEKTATDTIKVIRKIQNE